MPAVGATTFWMNSPAAVEPLRLRRVPLLAATLCFAGGDVMARHWQPTLLLVLANSLPVSYTHLPPPPPGAKAPLPTQGKPTIDRKYNLILIVEAENAINHVNLGTPIGVLGSSLFGRSNSLNGSSVSSNANRVILLDLLVRF